MAGHRFFCAQILPGPCELPQEEAHHAATVMRVRPDDEIELFDGCGKVASAVVERVSRRSVLVRVSDVRTSPGSHGPHLTLHVAAPKGPRQHVLVEKCTELGVAAIQPTLASRSVVRPNASLVRRWRRYAIEAGKQSGQVWLPEIRAASLFADSIVCGRTDESEKVIASSEPGAPSLADILRAMSTGARRPALAVWIGPEGGFTPEEIHAAVAVGVRPASLGDFVLRIETAAIAVAATVQMWAAGGCVRDG
jgi:16S rRNA (uracil1498-N3)-methyltransferase